MDVVSNEQQGKKSSSSATRYDYRYGETDLFEGSLRRRREMVVFGGMMALAAIICVGAVALLALRFIGADILPTTAQTTDTPTPAPTAGGVSVEFATMTALPIQTNTARPLPNLITVTPAPATAPPSPTPAPCIRQVASGDSLLGLALSCGHRDLDVIDLIVATNGLSAPEAIQIGQELIIPWPTPTLDPNQPTPPPDSEDTGTDGGGGGSNGGASAQEAAVFPTETLQPGVAWHTVVKDETMLSIAVLYGANAEILSQLNPEVEFSQCDFGMDSGGPRCIVTLIEGQQIRVPAPTPTPTIPPTPSGSETPTPTATPTFNAPSSLSPGDRAQFQQDELVTLRWVTTGTLGPNEVYRIRARDLTLGVDHIDDTRELFYVVPVEWQGTDGRRHEFSWSVSVIDLDEPDTPIFTTETRVFIWESRAGTA